MWRKSGFTRCLHFIGIGMVMDYWHIWMAMPSIVPEFFLAGLFYVIIAENALVAQHWRGYCIAVSIWKTCCRFKRSCVWRNVLLAPCFIFVHLFSSVYACIVQFRKSWVWQPSFAVTTIWFSLVCFPRQTSHEVPVCWPATRDCGTSGVHQRSPYINHTYQV